MTPRLTLTVLILRPVIALFCSLRPEKGRHEYVKIVKIDKHNVNIFQKIVEKGGRMGFKSGEMY